MSLKNFTFAQICQMIIVPAFFDTLKMLLISGFISTILGFVFGVILIVTEVVEYRRSNKKVHLIVPGIALIGAASFFYMLSN